MSQIAIKGAAAICEAVGMNRKGIARLVRESGLPAFKVEGKGNWVALPEDLHKWLRSQRDLALGGSDADRS